MARWIGVDVGGANIKLADMEGFARQEPFELWKRPRELPIKLREMLAGLGPWEGLAATMTGELADCYSTKAEGARAIADALEFAALGRRLLLATTEGELISVESARRSPIRVAAANWRALAQATALRRPRTDGVLIDIGSTTTDIVAFRGGEILAEGITDTQRLATGELLYFGVSRTPLCALSSTLPYRGEECPVMAELFATSADVFKILGGGVMFADGATADGRPLDLSHSVARMARMIGADSETFNLEDAREAARFLRDVMIGRIGGAIDAALRRLESPPQAIVVSGSGEALAKKGAERTAPACRVESLAESLGEQVSVCAAAEAVAFLASERATG